MQCSYSKSFPHWYVGKIRFNHKNMQKQIFNLSAGLDVQLLADFLDTILALGVGSQDLNNKLDISFFFSSYFTPSIHFVMSGLLVHLAIAAETFTVHCKTLQSAFIIWIWVRRLKHNIYFVTKAHESNNIINYSVSSYFFVRKV